MTAKFRQKRGLGDLALLGASPAFTEVLHVGTPNLGSEEAFLTRVAAIRRSRRLTNDGPLVRELEERIAELTETPHAVATCNATAGLQLLAHALGMLGDVVMPAFTFVATPHAFTWVRARPVFCDIVGRTHGVDPLSMARAADETCTGLVAVHTWGIPGDVEALSMLAERRRVPLVFDAAHAMGCALGSTPVGGFGSAEVFSLHATKVLNSFEGGVITTRDAALAADLRTRRDFGFADYDHVVSLGINAKLSEIHAAGGLTTLEDLPNVLAENRRCFEKYREVLAEVPGLRLLDVAERGRSNHQYVVVEVTDDDARAHRDLIVRALQAEEVRARRYFHPGCHRSAPYEGSRSVPLPVTERAAESVIVLPTGPTVGDEAIEVIGSILRLLLEKASELARHVQERS